MLSSPVVVDVESQQQPASRWSVAKQNVGLFWLVIWLLLNISVTIMNKAFFSTLGFGFPVVVSGIHMAFSSVFSFLTLRYYDIPTKELNGSGHLSICLFSLLFCSNVVVGNIGLRYVSVSLVQVVRSIIPAITMVLSILILKKTYSDKLYYVSILFVILGVAMASFGEIDFHVWGFLMVILVCFLSSLKSVISNKFLVGSLKFHPFDLLFRMSSLAFLQLILFAWGQGELTRMVEWWNENGSPPVAAALALNGTMAFMLNFSNFMTNKNTSALTITVAGNVKHVLTIILSFLVFRNPITPLNAVGTLTTLFGAAFYSYVDEVKKKNGEVKSQNEEETTKTT